MEALDFVILDDDEAGAPTAPKRPPWKVIVADDEPEVHRVTRLALSSFEYDGAGVTLLSAHSAEEALKLVMENPDAAVLLLDVVMETEHAGLDLVPKIRDEIGNRMIRIVLRTGQPGTAPETEVVNRYDINDYREKTELTARRLNTVMVSSLRAISLHRALAHEALTDTLTGIGNRRYLMEQASREFLRALRYQRPLTGLILDIDHFKKVNDTWGHAVGDEVIRHVAQQAQRLLRSIDVLGRMGGEEFGALLPESTIEQAREVAERLRKRIADTPVTLEDGRTLSVTVSIGVAAANPDDGNFEEVMERADQALYEAKRGGRNRVEVA